MSARQRKASHVVPCVQPLPLALAVATEAQAAASDRRDSIASSLGVPTADVSVTARCSSYSSIGRRLLATVSRRAAPVAMSVLFWKALLPAVHPDLHGSDHRPAHVGPTAAFHQHRIIGDGRPGKPFPAQLHHFHQPAALPPVRHRIHVRPSAQSLQTFVMAARSRNHFYDHHPYRSTLPTIWTLYTAFAIFLYQLSSALLVRSRAGDHKGRFAMHQLLNLLFGAITWYLFGYAFSFGRSLDTRLRNRFVGNYTFALHRIREANHNTTSEGYAWFFQSFCYAMVCNAIVAEGLGIRASRLAHVLSTVAVVGFLYPVVAHWVWSTDGWLSAIRPENDPPIGTVGAIDFAGSGVVHLLGGSVSLAASLFLRKGRFEPAQEEEGQAVLSLAAFLRIFVMLAYVTGCSVSIAPIQSDQSALAAVASALGYDLTKGLPVRGCDVSPPPSLRVRPHQSPSSVPSRTSTRPLCTWPWAAPVFA